MNSITTAAAIIISLLAIVYIVLAYRINKKAIVNIDGIVYAFKKKPSILPTLLGLAIIALVLFALHITCFDCISYTR